MKKTIGKRRSDRRTRIEFELGMHEDGGAIWLSVDSHTEQAAEKIFKRLHKKYCTILPTKPTTLRGYQ